MASPPQPPIMLASFNSEMKRVISAHSRHFLALTVLFVLPLAFLTTISNTLHSLLLLLTSHSHLQTLTLLRTSDLTSVDFLFPVISTISALVFFICAVGSISFSLYHGFFDEPVKLANALRSLLRSFLPLFATVILSAAAQLVISALAVIGFISISKGFEFLGFGEKSIDFSSTCVLISFISIACGLISLLVFLNVNWAMASVVVVVERCWGVAALRKSTKLVKGIRVKTLSFLLFFGWCIGFFAWVGPGYDQDLSDLSGNWAKRLGFVARTVAVAAVLTMFMFNCFIAITALYLYAKALNGELDLEPDEIVDEYTLFPDDEENVLPFVMKIPAA